MNPETAHSTRAPRASLDAPTESDPPEPTPHTTGADPAHGASSPNAPTSSSPADSLPADSPSADSSPADGGDGNAGVWAAGVMRFKAARLWVARNRPYYARALFSCPVAFTYRVDTISVNGLWLLKANPFFCAPLTAAQVGAVLVHEMNHLLRDHHGRSLRAGVPDEGLGLWSLAADFEVNDDLRDDGLDMPDGAIYPDEFGLEPGRLAEQYYGDLLDLARNMADDMADRSCDHDHTAVPAPGDVSGEGGLSRARQELVRRQTAQDVLDHCDNWGAEAAPGGLQQWALRQTEPQVDWRRLLASELRKGLHRRPGTGQPDWSRPPRRPDHGPVLRPGTARPTADIAVVVDTSGSMGDEDHARAIAETHTILTRAVPGEAIAVYSADTAAISAQTITQTRQISLTGGAGTDMGQAVIDAAQARPRPAVIIVITDGHTPWPLGRPPGVTATVIAVLTRPYTAAHVPQWITPIEAHASETEQ